MLVSLPVGTMIYYIIGLFESFFFLSKAVQMSLFESLEGKLYKQPCMMRVLEDMKWTSISGLYHINEMTNKSRVLNYF